MENQQTLNNIKTRELLSMLRKIALPIALQSLIGSSLNLIDNLMVGSLGELQLNAVGVSVQIFFIYWMLLYGISGGAATFISQFYGVSDFKNIRRTTGFTLTIALGIGLLFFIAAEAFPQYILRIFSKFPEVIEEGSSYVRLAAPTFLMLAVTQPFTIALRATQQTRLPLYASAVALATNTVLNYILIFGRLGLPALGVNGAALATAIARLLEMGLILYVVFGRKNKIVKQVFPSFSATAKIWPNVSIRMRCRLLPMKRCGGSVRPFMWRPSHGSASRKARPFRHAIPSTICSHWRPSV